jgi:hypothetical protein
MRKINAVLLTIFAALALTATGALAQTDAARTPVEKMISKKISTLPYYGVFDHITFKVEGGTVTLDGRVASFGTRGHAESAVRRVPGVDTVVNNIKQLPPSGFDDSIRRQMLRSVERSAGSFYRYLLEPDPSVRIIVENGHVTFEGFVAYNSDKSLANMLARSINGVFSVTNNLVVTRKK